jgi:hypothetical protein
VDNPIILEEDELDASESKIDYGSSRVESVEQEADIFSGLETGFGSRTASPPSSKDSPTSSAKTLLRRLSACRLTNTKF